MKVAGGRSVLEGIAIGPLRWFQPQRVQIPERSARTPEEELERLEQARRRAQAQLGGRYEKARKEAGADSVTTEFFCMESRADDRLKARYAAMSEVLGYDIHQFYMENSKQQGYKRLNRAIKAPIIHRMRELTHSLGMRFHVSDAFCRECNDACNCCGVPPEWGVSQIGNIGNAIIIAREKGFVTFSDVMESINKYFDFPWVGACGYNTGSNKARALLYDTTMAQWLRSNWNDTKKGTSPARAYGGVLVPDGKDENGDVIYRYAIKR